MTHNYNNQNNQNNQTLSDGTMYLSPDAITTEIPELPNLNIVYEVDKQNEIQRNRQKIYSEAITKIHNIITVLQKQHGNKLTRSMIETEINKYPELQNIYNQLPNNSNNPNSSNSSKL